MNLKCVNFPSVQIPFATKPHQLVIPMAGLGFAIGKIVNIGYYR